VRQTWALKQLLPH